jgi:group I intron endonuclease
MIEVIKVEKYIYKITNKINNKCYIGQTKDYEQRFTEHKRELRKNEHHNPHLQAAWNKYGEENFLFDILECTESYNEKEKYYITYYKSDNQEYGYNILPGGEEPPLLCGEDNYYSKLTQAEVDKMIEMLLADETLDCIEKAFPHITRSQICKINNGVAWRKNDLKYPLKEPDNMIGSNVASSIMYDLQYSRLKHKEIATKYNVSRTCVTALNLGKVNDYFDNTLTYPLRKHRITDKSIRQQDVVDAIICDLMNTDLSMEKIAKQYNVTTTLVYTINIGSASYQKDTLMYPLRNKVPHKVVSGVNDFATLYPHLLEEWDFDKNKILPTEIFKSSTEYVWWKCKNGHEWQSTVLNRTSGHNCMECYREKQSGINNYNHKPIAQYSKDGKLIKVWNYMKQASTELNISYTGISRAYHKGKSAGGFLWRDPPSEYNTTE